MSVPRMRTIKECADYFKQEDPETKLTYCTLRTWVLEGKDTAYQGRENRENKISKPGPAD